MVASVSAPRIADESVNSEGTRPKYLDISAYVFQHGNVIQCAFAKLPKKTGGIKLIVVQFRAGTAGKGNYLQNTIPMKFHPNYPNDNNKGQREVWRALKSGFENDDGIAYYRYPIFGKTGRGRSEPDFLMIHRRYGIWIFESKGCYIANIGAIEGHDWQMRDWYCESMSPVSQVEAQLFEVKTLVERDPLLRALKIPFEYRVVLPFVTSNEWRMQGYLNHPSTNGVVWLKDDMDMPRFRQQVQEASINYMPSLSDDVWERLKGVFRGVVSEEEPRQPEPNSPPTNYSRIIHAVESRLRVLDEKQDRISQEVPEGPQRLRGLAGSGKTVLFARRVAQMHAAHPEWDIAFVYWSRSLNQQIRDLVEKNYRRLTGESPNWQKLHVWHAWGSRELTGFYREISSRWGGRFLSFPQAKEAAAFEESPYDAACRLLEEENNDSPFLDAVVVDEGQDLPASFYRITYKALRDPKRLYWAYDEAQGVDSLVVPGSSEIFGRDATGRPIVDLSGSYPSGMQKAHNMNRCYRTPRLILTAAHAINMGLLRQGGPLQGVTRKEDWTALGYKVVEGDFSPTSVKSGATVVLERTTLTSGHPIDHPGFEPLIDHSSILTVQVTESETDDVNIVVSNIQRDLELGLRPEDIAVVSLEPFSLLKKVADQLQVLGIKTLSLDAGNRDQFREVGHVTLSGIRRAKGNEAYKIYALNLHMADTSGLKDIEDEMVTRNQIFVALTRTKLWCVAIGRKGAVMQELSAAANQMGTLRFPAFNQASLKRSLADLEAPQLELI